jgi:hypothetical protein
VILIDAELRWTLGLDKNISGTHLSSFVDTEAPDAGNRGRSAFAAQPLLLFGPKVQEYQQLGPDPSLPDARAIHAGADRLADYRSTPLYAGA